METLAYLHLTLAYEAVTDATEVYSLDSLKLFEWFKQQKLATHIRISLLSLVVILGILGMAGEAFAQRTLRLGDRGSDVTFIQNRLRQLRYLNQSADGVFDRTTQEAVIRFQRDYQLNPDGIVGPATESALFAEFDQGRRISTQALNFPTPLQTQRTLQRGDRNSDVTTVQRRLQELGYFNGPLTGYFGSMTQEAVIRFQQAYNIIPDGVVGSETRAALFGTTTARYDQGTWLNIPPPPPMPGDFPGERVSQALPTRVLRFGDRGVEVEELQRDLRRRGFNPGPIDGVYGSQTQEAVRQFQRSRGIFPDGVANRETLTALGLAAQPRRDRYIVVVPVQNENTLNQVRAIAGFANAVEADSKLGKYINAGAFPNRASAESRSYELRSRGLDARVAFQ